MASVFSEFVQDEVDSYVRTKNSWRKSRFRRIR